MPVDSQKHIPKALNIAAGDTSGAAYTGLLSWANGVVSGYSGTDDNQTSSSVHFDTDGDGVQHPFPDANVAKALWIASKGGPGSTPYNGLQNWADGTAGIANGTQVKATVSFQPTAGNPPYAYSGGATPIHPDGLRKDLEDKKKDC